MVLALGARAKQLSEDPCSWRTLRYSGFSISECFSVAMLRQATAQKGIKVTKNNQNPSNCQPRSPSTATTKVAARQERSPNTNLDYQRTGSTRPRINRTSCRKRIFLPSCSSQPSCFPQTQKPHRLLATIDYNCVMNFATVLLACDPVIP